jgi:hypothetical protein
MSVIKKILEFVVDSDSANKKIQDVKGNLKDATKETQNLNKNAKKTPKALKAMSKGFKAIGTAIKGAGIGIVIGLIAKLGEAFYKNQKFIDAFSTANEVLSRVMNDFVTFLIDSIEPVKAFFKDVFENPKENILALGDAIKKNLIERFDSFVDTLGLAGKAIKQVFEGDFAGAWETAKEAGKEVVDVYTGVDNSYDKIGKTLKKTGKAITDYAKETYNAADAQVELRKNAKLAEAEIEKSIFLYQNQIEKQRQVRDNENLTFQERLKASEKITGLLEKQGKDELKLANLRKQAAEADLAANPENVDLQIALIEAKTAVADVEERITGFKTEQQTAERALLKEQKEAAAEVRKIGKTETQLSIQEAKDKRDAQKLLINKTIEDETKRTQALATNEREYANTLNIIEEEKLKKLQEIKNKYIPDDEEGLSPQEKFELERERKREQFEKELEDLEIEETKKAKIREKYKKREQKEKDDFNETAKENRRKATEAEVGMTIAAVSSIVNALAEGSELAKGFAVAQALFNTYEGITKALTAPTLPQRIAGIAFASAAGFGAVKNILSTSEDGSNANSQNASGGRSATVSRGPRFDTVGDSRNVREAEREADRDTVPQEAYVVSSKVSSQQELDRNKQNNTKFI